MTVNRRDLLKRGGVTAAALAAGGATQTAQAQQPALTWDREADVVVIGAGACGLPASIVAREAGASVIVIEAQPHAGGHARVSGGNMPLGGGTSIQKRYGIHDTPDMVFSDLTDWSVVQPNGFPDYRYNDREILRTFADNSAATFEFLVAHGVVYVNKPPDRQGGSSVGNSVLRTMHVAPVDWPLIQTGAPANAQQRMNMSSGNGLTQPLEAAARKAGVDFLLEHRMTKIHREQPEAGRVLGVTVDNKGAKLNIRARKAVIVATGGSTGNLNFRRMFDPRLTEEYCGLAGMPYSNQDASGELAAMAINASLWGLFNFTAETGSGITKPGQIGCQYGYVNLRWQTGSPMFAGARATGLHVNDWQNVITVNMLGQRFYDETGRQFTANSYNGVDPYKPNSYLNAKNVRFDPNNWINAAMAGIGDGHNGGGPIWAVFDSAAVEREKWNTAPPNVDVDGGFFFAADTVAELAKKIKMKYQRVAMPAENLERTVGDYNGFVAAGRDWDFGKPRPLYTIAKPPFYAAWCTPVIHDTRAGLRINGKMQVVDMNGEVIPGLYCGGESAGGFSMHGLARCTSQGFVAGRYAAAESVAKAPG
jgi:succinate dehydrogenase/fumarate reductase flavoprotein subunit